MLLYIHGCEVAYQGQLSCDIEARRLIRDGNALPWGWPFIPESAAKG